MIKKKETRVSLSSEYRVPEYRGLANHSYVSLTRKSKRGTLYRTDLCPSFATDQSRASPDGRLDRWSFRHDAEGVARSLEAFSVTRWLRASMQLLISSGRAGTAIPARVYGLLVSMCVHGASVRSCYARIQGLLPDWLSELPISPDRSHTSWNHGSFFNTLDVLLGEGGWPGCERCLTHVQKFLNGRESAQL